MSISVCMDMFDCLFLCLFVVTTRKAYSRPMADSFYARMIFLSSRIHADVYLVHTIDFDDHVCSCAYDYGPLSLISMIMLIALFLWILIIMLIVMLL